MHFRKEGNDMRTIILRTTISVLWILMTLGLLLHGSVGSLEAGPAEKMEGGMLAGIALFSLIPMVMAFLSLTLKGSLNRWVNLVVAGLFTPMNLFHLWEHLTSPHHALIVGSTVVAAGLIVWYSWRWPAEKEGLADLT